MIYTLTLNPSIDYVVSMEKLVEGAVNRIESEAFYPGGKGINVSRVLTELGVINTAFGYVSGFTGAFINQELKADGIETDFIELEQGMSRINMKINAKLETEINGVGPTITDEDVKKLFLKLDELQCGDLLVLAGSIPSSLPTDFYGTIMSSLSERAIQVVVDASKASLLSVLKYKPFLIKPNHHELAELFEVTMDGFDDIVFYGKKLQELGAQNVLISRGKDGAVLLTDRGDVFQSHVPSGVVKNSVGAGDSMVAGFIAGYLKDHSYVHALQLGAACGSATAFCSDVAKRQDIEDLMSQIQIEKITHKVMKT
ncbi:MAG TPA: 1-phosphofructokinase [Firmicutes bacterium]|nr:1-phosphofructokinase [Bacillota bacterium]